MTVYSQNGYRANDKSLIATYPIPETSPLVSISMRKGDVAVVLQWAAHRWDSEVEPLEGPIRDDWGYAPRPIRGSSTVLSNHASGTAIDCNATQHPRGVSLKATFSAGQIGAVRAIVHDAGGVLRWGGDYVSAPCDGMHIEINAGTAAVAALASKIRAGKVRGSWVGFPAPRPVAAPAVVITGEDMGTQRAILVRSKGTSAVFLSVDQQTLTWIHAPASAGGGERALEVVRYAMVHRLNSPDTRIYDIPAGELDLFGVRTGVQPPPETTTPIPEA